MELKFVKGLSDKRIQELNKTGIYSVEQLIRRFPRKYLDLTRIMPLKNAYAYEYVFTKAKLISLPESFLSARKMRCVKAVCAQNGEIFDVIWFNQPYVIQKLDQGCEYLFYGRIQSKFGRISMVNPTFEKADKNQYLKGILPVYTLPDGFFQRTMQSVILDAIEKKHPKSLIPYKLEKKYSLSNLHSAFKQVHSPVSFDEKDRASDRVAVEEFFLLISAFKIIKGDKQQVRINRYSTKALEINEFSKRFGFDFTNGQKKAVNEIFADMNSPHVMNRLMQGDVGCGKTAVALCALYVALKSGYQAAMLAPTEVLALQNYNLAKKFFPEFKVELLSGMLSVKEKNAVKSRLKSGEANLVVGTHAILQKNVEFKNLALCICDEQHRFGVAQRTTLISKGTAPDLLVMSATPIPRTLSLIFYGDLDITEITEKPSNRTSVQTNIIPQEKYDGMYKFIASEINQGKKVYFVAPKIEEDIEGEIMSVTELYKDLVEKMPQVKICLLHGKMKEKEKNEIMNNFKNGDCMALVSTTVIEVGIDVPVATIMVIYNADRFGLAQLHQLRGRVGRGVQKSYCFLLSSTDNPDAIERLKTLCKSNDGFKIAEADFKMRGSGDFMGTRQSGAVSSELGALNYSVSSVFLAKKIAEETFDFGLLNDEIKSAALEKYDKLCNVSLN